MKKVSHRTYITIMKATYPHPDTSPREGIMNIKETQTALPIAPRELSRLEMAFFQNKSHDRIVDTVPKKGNHHGDGDYTVLRREYILVRRKDSGRNGILHQKRTDQSIAGIAEDTRPRIQNLRQRGNFVPFKRLSFQFHFLFLS